MNEQVITEFVGLIGRASTADAAGLRELRTTFIDAVKEMGARNFVEMMAVILGQVLKTPGCDDAKLPLKKIFNVSPAELAESLATKRFDVAPDHPINTLAKDHIESINRLQKLVSRFETITRENIEEDLKAIMPDFDEYYDELDRHIRKEEEVLFPRLVAGGMKEHPDVLIEEHKKFHRLCTDIQHFFARSQWNSAFASVGSWRTEFVQALCNHVFRETHIFYPAALEFIKDANDWKSILERINSTLSGGRL